MRGGSLARWMSLILALVGVAPALALVPESDGCGTTAPAAGVHTVVVLSGGRSRPVRVFVPPAAAPRHALPLVIDLHASGSNGEQQARLTRLSEVAATHGFLLANPDGGVSFSSRPERHYWNIPGVPLAVAGDTPADAPDDVQFISDAIDQISAYSCVDARRVYVTGMSGGARMSSLLGCRLANRIAAIAPVAGLRAGLPWRADPTRPDPASCQPQRPLPIVTFHGTDDHTNPYSGGGSPYWGYDIPTALRRWAELDHCMDQASPQQVAAHVRLIRYTHCAGGSEIWLYRTELPGDQGGGHAWPGGTIAPEMLAADAPEPLRENIPSREIDASALIWEFFSRHELPASAASGTP